MGQTRTASPVDTAGRSTTAEPDLIAALAGISAAAVAAVRGADYAGIIQAHQHGRGRAQAPTHDIAGQLDALQTELPQGPWMSAQRDRLPVAIPDLDAESRWPIFAARATELGVHSMLLLPLVAQHTHGTLNLYASVDRAFTHDDEIIAQIFAAHAAMALYTATRPR